MTVPESIRATAIEGANVALRDRFAVFDDAALEASEGAVTAIVDAVLPAVVAQVQADTAAEIAELRAVIEKAPHDEDCSINDWYEWWEGIAPDPTCTCWKSSVEYCEKGDN